MKTHAEFQIIGVVGKLIEAGSVLKVSVAADYGTRDDRGEYQSNSFWNTVTIFNERTAAWVRENVAPGDMVHTRGTLRETSYEKNGAPVYGITLAADQFDLIRKKTAA